MKLKVGLIGVGRMGSLYAEICRQKENTELVALCDSNEKRVTKKSQQYSVKAYTGYKELFRKEKLDMVYVGTPDFLHKEITLDAINKDIHVLVEKPLATSVEDAQQMVEALHGSNLKGQVCFVNRWNPPFMAAKKILKNQELGKILTVNTQTNDTIFVPTKMLSWANKTTPGWFLLTHTLDMVDWLLNKRAMAIYAVAIKEHLISKGINTYDSIHAVVSYEEGTKGFFESCWVLPEGTPSVASMKIQFVGTSGSLMLRSPGLAAIKITNTYYKNIDVGTIDTFGRLYTRHSHNFNSFVSSIINDTPPMISFEEGLRNVKILSALHKSIEIGEVQQVEF